MAVAIRLGSNQVIAGAPRPLFAFRTIAFLPQSNGFAYGVAASGQRFLVRAEVNTGEPTLNVVVNWEKAVPVKER